MPLLSGGLVVITTPEEVDTGPTTPYFETVGVPSFTWIDPDGREWPLSNASEDIGWFTTVGPAGWGAAPVELTTDRVPSGGVRLRAVEKKPSTLQWPLEIFGRYHDEYVGRKRSISRAFTMTSQRGQAGIMRVQRPDGSTREIECLYQEGLAGEAGQDHLWSRPVVTLLCPDGKWRATQPVVAVRTFTPTTTGGGTPVSFYSPFMSLTSSRVVGSGTPTSGAGDTAAGDDSGSLTMINNPGDVEAWPIWTVTGPMTELRAWNATLGTRFALTYPLADQQTVTITTSPSTVRGPGNASLSKYIDWFNPAGTELWPLLDGDNVVGLEVDGAGANTSVEMSFVPRYDGA